MEPVYLQTRVFLCAFDLRRDDGVHTGIRIWDVERVLVPFRFGLLIGRGVRWSCARRLLEQFPSTGQNAHGVRFGDKG